MESALSPGNSSSLRIAIWGATGATGSELLRQCLRVTRISEIRVFTRRALTISDQRIKESIVSDFADTAEYDGQLMGLDSVYWCLGVSQTVVRDEKRYREITHDYPIAAACALQKESSNAMFHFVSGAGADPSGKSRMMFARVKGETEVALTNFLHDRLIIWRPAYIHAVAGREHPSLADRFGAAVYPVMRFIPGMVNTTVDIAHAMLQLTFNRSDQPIINARAINRLAKRHRRSDETTR